ncbi:MAG: hypothetical protein V1820_02240 [archaeon]
MAGNVRPLEKGDRVYVFVTGFGWRPDMEKPVGKTYGSGSAELIAESPVIFPPDDFDDAARFKVEYRSEMEREIFEAVLRASLGGALISYKVLDERLVDPAKTIVWRVAETEPELALEPVKSVEYTTRLVFFQEVPHRREKKRIIRVTYKGLEEHPDVLIASMY